MITAILFAGRYLIALALLWTWVYSVFSALH